LTERAPERRRPVRDLAGRSDSAEAFPAVVVAARLSAGHGHTLGFDTPALIAVRLTAPYFHQGGGGVEFGPADPAAARQALRTAVLPYYNARFQLRFTDAELDDLTEFLLSL
jgi:hypothetical protein